MKKEAIVRNLIPFLTEFGGSNDWTNLETNLEPTEIYKRNKYVHICVLSHNICYTLLLGKSKECCYTRCSINKI